MYKPSTAFFCCDPNAGGGPEAVHRLFACSGCSSGKPGLVEDCRATGSIDLPSRSRLSQPFRSSILCHNPGNEIFFPCGGGLILTLGGL